MSVMERMKMAGFVAGRGDPDGGSRTLSMPAAKVGLCALLGVITVLFFLLVIAYLSRSQFGDWQSLAGAPWRPLSNPRQLWVNTAMLLASSIAFQWARVATHRGNPTATKISLGLAGLFAIAFLIGQLLVWQQLRELGYFIAVNPANSFFYLITGLHGLHLLGGLVAWGNTSVKVWRGAQMREVRLSVELCTLYWHFLFVLWLVLFALLASPQETIEAFAAICGLR